MFGIFRKAPRAGDTDEAARRILDLMEREEREKEELRRLAAEGWRPPAGGAQPSRERRFGDGRDDLMQIVQSGLDERQARQDEARRRVQMAQAGAEFPLPPRKPMAPPASPFSIPPRKPVAPGSSGPHPRDRFRLPPPWLRDPRATRIIEEIMFVEGGKWDDPAGGRTNHGITRAAIKEWKRLAALRGFADPTEIPDDPYQLTYDQAFRVLKQAYYGKYKFDTIANERLAHQLADIGINSSREGFEHIVNGALGELMHKNSMFGEEIRPLAAGVFRVDPNTKKKSWFIKPSRYDSTAIERLNRLADSELGQELRNAIVRHRVNYLKQQPDFNRYDGWMPRALRFVEWTDTQEERPPIRP